MLMMAKTLAEVTQYGSACYNNTERTVLIAVEGQSVIGCLLLTKCYTHRSVNESGSVMPYRVHVSRQIERVAPSLFLAIL